MAQTTTQTLADLRMKIEPRLAAAREKLNEQYGELAEKHGQPRAGAVAGWARPKPLEKKPQEPDAFEQTDGTAVGNSVLTLADDPLLPSDNEFGIPNLRED